MTRRPRTLGARARHALLALTCIAGPACSAGAEALDVEIRTVDVERFYALYDATGATPSAEALQRDYLGRGTPGLEEFARLRGITGERIARKLAERPALYADARRCAARLPHVRERLHRVLLRLRELYPGARLPPATIAVGRGAPVGVGTATGVYVGVEALCAWTAPDPDVDARFVRVIAHEYVHVQQPATAVEDPNDTVLEAALVEGAAELVTELISGSVAYRHLAAAARGRELELETAFLRDVDRRAVGSEWVYDGAGTPERPGDIGYWIGYRIAKSYYARAADKRAALREIIEMQDAKAFFAASGWCPGIRLERSAGGEGGCK